MELAFRQFSASDSARPGPGELWIQAHVGPAASRSDLAAIVLEQGIQDFPHGEMPIHTIVVSDDPTLDDLLAYSFSRRALEDTALPDGCRSFAKYTELVRRGHRPSTIPLHVSLEGIFLAIRNAARGPGERLTDPEVVARFKADWGRMEERIMKAAATGQDPFTTSLFAEGPEFALERAFLANDEKVYRQDLMRGERWQVKITEATTGAGGLLLRQPASLLFKHWSREDRDAAGGKGYLFLAVQGNGGQWRFSTDPTYCLPIKSLAEQLQQKETKNDPQRASSEPWFDGARLGYTLVAAPHRGTRLSNRQVERVVKHWCHAKVLGPRPWRWIAAAAIMLLGVAGLIGYLVTRPRPLPVPAPIQPFRATVAVNYQKLADDEVERQVDDDALLYAVNFERDFHPGEHHVEVSIPRPLSQPMKVRVELRSPGDLSSAGPVLLINTDRPQEQHRLPPAHPLAEGAGQEIVSEDVGALFSGWKDNTVIVNFKTTGSEPQRIHFRIAWQVDLDYRRDLHLLSIGVAEYKANLDLPYADKETTELAEVFLAQDDQHHGAFRHVEKPRLGVLAKKPGLTNSEATKDNFLAALAALKPAPNEEAGSLVLVTFSGHGKLDQDGTFFFLPYDYRPTDAALASSAVSWDDVARELDGFHCPVVMLVDACHSGGIQLAQARAAAEKGAKKVVSKTSDGVVVIASCGGSEVSWVKDEWQHSVLTLAMLEVLQGKRLVNEPAKPPLPQEKGSNVVTLKDLYDYAQERVAVLTENQQNTACYYSDGLRLDEIVIARRKK
jgi:hypothetical protein